MLFTEHQKSTEYACEDDVMSAMPAYSLFNVSILISLTSSRPRIRSASLQRGLNHSTSERWFPALVPTGISDYTVFNNSSCSYRCRDTTIEWSSSGAAKDSWRQHVSLSAGYPGCQRW
jgi:hypothetical protein